MNFIDITGQRFNKLTVLERVPDTTPIVWKCLCDCGNITYVRGSNLKTGAVKSCGCLSSFPHSASHHLSKSRIYNTWSHMRSRCNNPTDNAYKDYGGRGISVCDEWNNSFEAFNDWADSSGYSDDLFIDRINNDGDYTPDNCQWSSMKEQANNRRTNQLFTYGGKTQNLTQWCEELGLNYKRVHNRIFKKGWSFEDAITRPVDVNKRNMKARSIYNV